MNNLINLNSIKRKEELIFKSSRDLRKMFEEVLPNLIEEYLEFNGEIQFNAVESMISTVLENIS